MALGVKDFYGIILKTLIQGQEKYSTKLLPPHNRDVGSSVRLILICFNCRALHSLSLVGTQQLLTPRHQH